MKLLIGTTVLLLSFTVFGNGFIKDFDYRLTDLASKELKKEDLFQNMQRKMLDLEHSICANRAHLWAWDFQRFYGIKTGKIFIFFGKSIWAGQPKGYMYHVAPYIVENGQEFVMEASYNDLTRPLTIKEWIENETEGRAKAEECVEIDAKDTDLTEYFYYRYTLPERRENNLPDGRCYIRKVPGHYWYPMSIAFHDLKKDADGNEIEYAPTEFEIYDVLSACAEAAGSERRCRKYLGL